MKATVSHPSPIQSKNAPKINPPSRSPLKSIQLIPCAEGDLPSRLTDRKYTAIISFHNQVKGQQSRQRPGAMSKFFLTAYLTHRGDVWQKNRVNVLSNTADKTAL